MPKKKQSVPSHFPKQNTLDSTLFFMCDLVACPQMDPSPVVVHSHRKNLLVGENLDLLVVFSSFLELL